jgi:hypothetical protein
MSIHDRHLNDPDPRGRPTPDDALVNQRRTTTALITAFVIMVTLFLIIPAMVSIKLHMNPPAPVNQQPVINENLQ